MSTRFMRKAALAIAVLAFGFGVSAHAAEQQTQWTQCRYDAQCEVITGMCGEPMGVNTTYLAEAQAWADQRQAGMHQCRMPRHPPAQLTDLSAFCMGGVCMVKPDKTYAVIHHDAY